MKKKYFLLFPLLFIGIGAVEAQYTDIHDFNGTQGSTPEGSLTHAGNKLYGMTNLGGANNYGCVFSMDTNGANYKDILDFNITNGKWPYYGTLVYLGGLLYGMTAYGGATNNGCIFSIDTNGTKYKDLHDFNGTAGKIPEGSLTLLGKTLFGMTSVGGANTDGCIFSIDTNGSNYKDFFDFTGTNGAAPVGDLTPSLSGKVLYGTTSLGGFSGNGNIFSIDTNGSRFKDLLDFNDQNTPEGSNPPGVLTLLGSHLFGMATNGGLIDFGIIFSIDTNGSGYKDLYEFNNTDGGLPQGSLSLAGTVLYGMTTYGAGAGEGCVFSIDTNGSAYKVLLNFNSTNSSTPLGSLTLSGNMAYATASKGGTNSDGTVFSINYKALGIDELTTTPNVIKVYPNPGNGQFTMESSVENDKSLVEIYNLTGEKVYAENLSQGTSDKNVINISNQPCGVYLYRILKENGDLMGEGKIVISR